ncbi:hypothetical protein [Apilactobacillus xinyiensis]|uniref:hypothetical protein n=1 Tax=Apilactobacillus xinyiensis TaxID=2841032 RepID=UPI00200E2E35|nr:hypothetical protein [Apilactobacillus xinyiensis]MCL0330581.1 hypothetical protein [Apilactobacillus xinyiensis]
MKHKNKKQPKEIHLNAQDFLNVDEQSTFTEENATILKMRMTTGFVVNLDKSSLKHLIPNMYNKDVDKIEISLENNGEKYIGNIYGIRFNPDGQTQACASVTKRYLNGELIEEV